MTMYTAAMDERIRVAVASGSCNTFADRVSLRQGACGAQILSGLMPDADTYDLFGSLAPRPLQLQWGRRDPLIIHEPAQAGVRQIERCYRAAGAADRFEVHPFEGEHVFAFEAAQRWLDRWLLA